MILFLWKLSTLSTKDEKLINFLSPSFKNLWYPERFHQFRNSKNFFEGWYYKIENDKGSKVYALIIGFYNNRESGSAPFIQLVDGKKNTSIHYKFSEGDFKSTFSTQIVQIGNNSFSADGFSVDLPGFSGAFTFKNQTVWQKSILAPNILGPLSFWPFLECNHCLISLNHEVTGEIIIDKRVVNFSKGRGYIEKDWGRSFPEAHIWVQSNRFSENTNTFLSKAIAKMKIAGKQIVGFAAVLVIDEKQQVFSSYNFSSLDVKSQKQELLLKFKGLFYSLKVKSTFSNFTKLVAPNKRGMEGYVNESLDAETLVTLKNHITGKTINQAIGLNSGVEIVGDWSS